MDSDTLDFLLVVVMCALIVVFILFIADLMKSRNSSLPPKPNERLMKEIQGHTDEGNDSSHST